MDDMDDMDKNLEELMNNNYILAVEGDMQNVPNEKRADSCVYLEEEVIKGLTAVADNIGIEEKIMEKEGPPSNSEVYK